MKLGYVERKYLRRLSNSAFSDTDRFIKSALKTLRQLEEKGLVQHVNEDGKVLSKGCGVDEGYFWEITDEGEQALAERSPA